MGKREGVKLGDHLPSQSPTTPNADFQERDSGGPALTCPCTQLLVQGGRSDQQPRLRAPARVVSPKKQSRVLPAGAGEGVLVMTVPRGSRLVTRLVYPGEREEAEPGQPLATLAGEVVGIKETGDARAGVPPLPLGLPPADLLQVLAGLY